MREGRERDSEREREARVCTSFCFDMKGVSEQARVRLGKKRELLGNAKRFVRAQAGDGDVGRERGRRGSFR